MSFETQTLFSAKEEGEGGGVRGGVGGECIESPTKFSKRGG